MAKLVPPVSLTLCRINLWARGARAPGPAPRGAPRLRVAPLDKRKEGERKRVKKEKRGERARKKEKEKKKERKKESVFQLKSFIS